MTANGQDSPVRPGDGSAPITRRAHIFIKTAWITGIIWILCSSAIAAGSFILLYVPLFSPSIMLLFVPFLAPIINAVIVTFLVIGLRRKSRACAVILFIHVILHLIPSLILYIDRYFTGDRDFLMEFSYLNITSYVLLLIFAVLFYLGILGTYSYRKAVRAESI